LNIFSLSGYKFLGEHGVGSGQSLWTSASETRGPLVGAEKSLNGWEKRSCEDPFRLFSTNCPWVSENDVYHDCLELTPCLLRNLATSRAITR